MQISTLWLTLLALVVVCKRNHSEIFLIFLRPVPLSSTFQNLNSSISNFDFLNAFCGQTWIPGKHHNRDSFLQQRWKVLVLLRYSSLLSGLWNIYDQHRNTNMNINKEVGQLTKFDCTTNRTKIIYEPFYSSVKFRVFIWFFCKRISLENISVK